MKHFQVKLKAHTGMTPVFHRPHPIATVCSQRWFRQRIRPVTTDRNSGHTAIGLLL